MSLDRKANKYTATYIVAKESGFDFFANGINDHLTVQAAVDKIADKNSTNGAIYIKDGVYDWGAAVDIDGNSIENITIFGDGKYATEFQMSGNDHCFEITNGCTVNMHDFQIDLATKNGHGIYASTQNASSTIYSRFSNILIRRVASGYWGFYAINPSYLSVDHMQINCSGGNGFRFQNDYSGPVNRGNSTVNHLNVELASGTNNTIGVELDSIDGNGLMNMNSFYHVNVLGLGTAAANDGRIGILLDDAWRNTFVDCGLETKNIGIELVGSGTYRCSFNRFYGGYITADEDCFKLAGSDDYRGNVFKDFECAELGSASAYLIREGNTAGTVYEGNIYENIVGTGTWRSDYIKVNEEAQLKGKTGLGGTSPEFAENSGRAEASDGDTITHDLISVDADDLHIVVNVLESDAHYAANAEAISTTTFTLSLYDITDGAAEAVNKTIMWRGWYKATDAP
jgi:hypothetical protein